MLKDPKKRLGGPECGLKDPKKSLGGTERGILFRRPSLQWEGLTPVRPTANQSEDPQSNLITAFLVSTSNNNDNDNNDGNDNNDSNNNNNENNNNNDDNNDNDHHHHRTRDSPLQAGASKSDV